MGWWVYLNCPCCGRCYYLDESQQEGGTIVIGGSWETEMSVTYNYSKFFSPALGHGFRELDDKKAGDTIDLLEKAVQELGTKQSPDYWEATKGNAGHILNIMLSWAKQFPDGVWRVS